MRSAITTTPRSSTELDATAAAAAAAAATATTAATADWGQHQR